MEKIIDLRSDTITQPSPEMRKAMADAEIGDDLHGEDPTTKKLEAICAERMKKEAAMFVPSGTMANLIAFLVLCKPGSEIILEEKSYTYWSESGSWARFGGLQARLLKGKDGVPPFEEIQKAIRPKDLFEPCTGAICLENPHNWAGGIIISPKITTEISKIAHSNGIPLYIDGARIFNAAVAANKPVHEFAKDADAIMFCLMKGLCCPAGAVLCGSKDFIEEARYTRQALGGGMAMPGILAAAGIVALEKMVDRLVDDNENAILLAKGIDRLNSPLKVDLDRVQTNMVFVDISVFKPGREVFLKELERENVKCWGILDRWIRFVTHYGIEKEDIQYTIKAIERVLLRLT